MLTPPSKYEELPDPIQTPSNSSHHSSFPPLLSQSEIGRNYQAWPVTENGEGFLFIISRCYLFKRTAFPLRSFLAVCWYVRANQKIADVLDELGELERIRSIDEFQVALGGSTAELEGALTLARKMKAAILDRVGSELRCSIGIGPNQLLAKIAGKLEKPDGLQWLAPENMPQAIAHLQLDDLPGISRGIKRKLHRAMIWDVQALYALDPRHARQIWHSVEGERFVRALQGANIPLGTTQRSRLRQFQGSCAKIPPPKTSNAGWALVS